MNKQYFVTGIGTDVGKTVVSAILSESLQATYWKPIQAGDLNNSDSIKVARLTKKVTVLEEAFKLTEPMSPHAAAAIDGIEISIQELQPPKVEGPLIVEGAGGLMVPFNSNAETFLDLASSWKLPTIIVSRHYLGSINHSLMTVELLQQNNIEIEGLVFVGEEHPTTEKIILDKTGVRMIARIPIAKELNSDFISEQANRISW